MEFAICGVKTMAAKSGPSEGTVPRAISRYSSPCVSTVSCWGVCDRMRPSRPVHGSTLTTCCAVNTARVSPIATRVPEPSRTASCPPEPSSTRTKPTLQSVRFRQIASLIASGISADVALNSRKPFVAPPHHGRSVSDFVSASAKGLGGRDGRFWPISAAASPPDHGGFPTCIRHPVAELSHIPHRLASALIANAGHARLCPLIPPRPAPQRGSRTPCLGSPHARNATGGRRWRVSGGWLRRHRPQRHDLHPLARHGGKQVLRPSC
jgi:hypothetical protein